MNIDSIPSHMLQRGIIVSIMERERPFIESFTNGHEIISVAFVQGLPISFNIFMAHMGLQFAPNITRKMIGSYDINVPDIDSWALDQAWRRAELPSEVRERISALSQHHVIRDVVTNLYVVHRTVEDAIASFKEFIRRIDEDLTSSLIDPAKI